MADQQFLAVEQIYVPSGIFGQDGLLDLTHPLSDLWPFYQEAIFPVLALTAQFFANILEGTVRFLPNEILNVLFT